MLRKNSLILKIYVSSVLGIFTIIFLSHLFIKLDFSQVLYDFFGTQKNRKESLSVIFAVFFFIGLCMIPISLYITDNKWNKTI